MGATSFGNVGVGANAQEAWERVVGEAREAYGNDPYSGTIATKRKFTLIPVHAGIDPMAHARDLMNNDDPRIEDKWGPAGCVALGGNRWYFFGWAPE
jgi:hypothetical protein